MLRFLSQATVWDIHGEGKTRGVNEGNENPILGPVSCGLPPGVRVAELGDSLQMKLVLSRAVQAGRIPLGSVAWR